MSQLFYFGILLLSFTVCDKIFALPSDIERCKIDDDKCLLKSANKVLWKYYGGINDIDLVSLDPFLVDYIKVVQDAGVVKVTATANDTYVRGFSKGKIEKITGFDKNIVEIKFRVPKLIAKGKYSSASTVLGIPINGRGPYSVTFNEFAGVYRITLMRYKKDGKTYFKINNSKLTFNSSGGELDIPDLGYFINAFINASYDLIIKRSLQTSIADAWTTFLGRAFSNAFSKAAIEDLFLI